MSVVRGGAARAGGGVDSNSTGGSDCPTEEGGAAHITGAVYCEARCGRSSTDADGAVGGEVPVARGSGIAADREDGRDVLGGARGVGCRSVPD